MSVIPFPSKRASAKALLEKDRPRAKKQPAGAKAAAPTKRRKASHMSAGDILALLSSTPEAYDIDFDAIYHLTEGAANEDLTNPVVATGFAELALRRLTEKFGFERLPFTYGELFGLLDYCSEMGFLAGDTMAEEVRNIWIQNSVKSAEKISPLLVPALKCYIAGDVEAMRRHHRKEQMLERLGREYRIPDDV